MSGARKSTVGAPARHTLHRCGSGPPLGYSPGARPARLSAAFTNIGSGYSAFPAAATASTYRARCQAVKISSACAPVPNTSDHVPGMRPPSSAAGTASANACCAASQRSAGSSTMPTSFSTCTISTVRSAASAACRWRISAAKARASARRFSALKAVSCSVPRPPVRAARGKRRWSTLIQAGA